MNKRPILFAGSSLPELAEEISAELGIPLGRRELSQFPDGETSVKIQEDVFGRDVFVLQSIATDPNRYLVELLMMIDALKRSSAKNIVAIIPYLGYCRQDRKNKPGVPITAKLVANLLRAAGVTRLITFDLHADQVEGFFEIPVDHLRCQKLLCDEAKKWIGENCIIVAPDIGSIKIARAMAKLLNAELAVVNKQRLNSFDVKGTLIGDVANKNVLIADDLCSTGGTLVAAANLCRELGALKIVAAVTHGLFAGDALQKIDSSALEALFITNSVVAPSDKIPNSLKVNISSLAAMIAEAIKLLNKN
jgi:ribose-phosphate pyrophosphokinase